MRYFCKSNLGLAFMLVVATLLVLSLQPCPAAIITGGTGPGGFEVLTTGSTLLVWLRSDTITGLADGDPVSAWANSAAFPGAGSNATQTNTDHQPTFESGAGDLINGQPVVRFGFGPSTPPNNNPADALTGTVTVGLDKTYFLVVKDQGTPGTCCAGGIDTLTGSQFNGLETVNSSGSSRLFLDRDGAGYAGTSSILNTPVVGTAIYHASGTALYRDGTLENSNAIDWRRTGTNYQIGARWHGSIGEYGRYFKGDMAEAGLFNRLLNTAERQILENALGARYGVALSTNDRYAGDDAAKGNYDLDVFGIGRVDAANQVTTAGSAGAGIEAPGNLTDGTFVLAGHKTPTNTRVAADMPQGFQRWNRVWYVDKTGNADVRIGFDSSNAGLPAAAPNVQFTLMYSPTNAFAFTPVETSPSVAGTLVTFDVPDARLSDGYYTLAEATPITGGTGPGGIESTQTTSSLLYWLKADAGVTKDGSNQVSAWADQSSRSNNFSQANSGQQPLFVGAAIGGNNLPAIRFDGADAPNNDRLELTNPTTPRTVFLVNRIETGAKYLAGIFGSTNPGDKGIRRWSNTEWRHPGDANDFTNPTGSAMFVNGAATNQVNENVAHILTALRGSDPMTYNVTTLGGYYPARDWKGDIGEVIVYDRVLNLAERSIVENALSAKYAIPLAAGDYYTGDDAAKGDYDLDVFGIGRVDAANAVYNSGAAGLGILAAGGTLGDNEWVLAGHRAAVNSLVADSGYLRWNRVWNIDVTGNVDISLTFDFSDAGLTPLGSGQPVALLYSPTNAFQFVGLEVAGTVYGDQVSFFVPGALLLDGYYTLGIVPEPASISLLAFGAILLALLAGGRLAKAR